MKTAHLSVLLAVSAVIFVFSYIPECSAWDPVIIEVPGYAKRVLGTTSNITIVTQHLLKSLI